MQMKIGRWEGLYSRIQSAAKHIRCGFVCGYRKIAGPYRSERSAIIGAAQPGVHGPTQARTGPPRRSESNESMEHHCRKRACLVVNLSASVTSGRCPIGNNLRRLPIQAEDYVAGVRFGERTSLGKRCPPVSTRHAPTTRGFVCCYDDEAPRGPTARTIYASRGLARNFRDASFRAHSCRRMTRTP
jgi:hypothetical protein